MGKTFSTGNLTNGISQDTSNNIGIGGAPSGSYKFEVTGASATNNVYVQGDGAYTGGALFIKQYASGVTNITGYNLISSQTSGHYFSSSQGGSFKNFLFDPSSLTDATLRSYTLPDASGTLALTSNLSSYLPLAGGTLTGALIGTTATFSSTNGYLYLNAANSGGNEAGIFYQIGGSNKWENYTAANDTALNWYSYGNSTVVFKLASTGAATFSSSVTAVTQGASNGFNTGAFIAKSNGNTARYTQVGYDNSGNYGWIQALEQGTAYTNLILNGAGGNIGIATTSPLFSGYAQLTVNGTQGGIAIQGSSTGYSRLFFAKDDTSNVEGIIRYYHSDNSMQFFTSAAERMRITSGGNVGIGTSSPNAKLDINGGDLYIRTGGLLATNTIDSYNTTLTIKTNGTTALSIASNQAATFSSSVTTSNGIISNYGRINGRFFITNESDYGDMTSTSGMVSIGYYPAGQEATIRSRNYSTSTNTKLTFDASQFNFSGGNVGIGTSSPSGRLEVLSNDVDTNFSFFSTAAATNRFLLVVRNTGNSASVDMRAHGSSYTETIMSNSATNGVSLIGQPASTAVMSMGTGTNSPLVIGTNNTERMRINAAGYIGIGITGYSSVKLSIKGETSNSSTQAFHCYNSSDADLFYVRNDGLISTGTTTLSPYNFTTGTGANVVVDGSGFLYRSTSSLKYKTNVTDYDKGLDVINKIRPVYYNSKNNGDTLFAGLIAEDIHDLGLTEFVQYAEDGTPDALSYSNMVALLIKGIQELKSEIDELKNK